MNRAPAALAIGLPVTTSSVSTLRFDRRLGHAPVDTVETAAAHAGFLVGLGGTLY